MLTFVPEPILETLFTQHPFIFRSSENPGMIDCNRITPNLTKNLRFREIKEWVKCYWLQNLGGSSFVEGLKEVSLTFLKLLLEELQVSVISHLLRKQFIEKVCLLLS